MTPAPVFPSDEGRDLPARCYLERAVVANLLAFLHAHNWQPFRVYDGGETLSTTTPAAAMAAIFAVDDSTLWVRKGDATRSIAIVLGNGEDCIVDHSAPTHDPEGFTAAMDEYARKVLPSIVSGEGLHKALALANERAERCKVLGDVLDAARIILRGYGVTFQDAAVRGLLADAVAKADGTKGGV